MNKKLLSLVLSLVMVLGTFTSAFAAETTTTTKTDEKLGEKVETVEKITGKDNKIQYIIDKKFVEGYENGDYGYDKEIKRSEITKLIVFANGNKELAEKLQGSMKLYNDVDTAFWANGVISVGTTVPSSANGQAMLNGYPDGSFKPEKNVTYAELSKMLVVLVKEDLTADMMKDANAKWATQWMSWAAQLGILDDVTVANSDAPATRADAFTMLYNALYKMQDFKRVPANEKVGVLSQLNKSKLTLNQDSEQEYTITDSTVFVNTIKDNKISNTTKVNSITNPEYYYGSLVRVMYNDKKEVTHILELGNPKEMALGRDIQTVGSNDRWNGVADSTVSTGWTNIDSLTQLKDNKITFNGYAELGFKDSSKIDVNKITFRDLKNNNGKDFTLKVSDKTKVYVANPANNQMKEVKDIYEALRLIGYNQDNYTKVPNVYAGYDKNSTKDVTYDPSVSSGSELAKVVVFNVVSKDAKGTLYRVLESSSSLGVATLEDVDGRTYDKDHFTNINSFPYNYGSKFDVISVGGVADSVTTKLDHSDTDKYPIVKVTKVDGKLVTVDGVGGRSAVINIADADVFTSKGPKVEKGAIIQIAAEKDANKVGSGNNIEIVSIKPDGANASTWEMAGNIHNVISDTNSSQVYSIGIKKMDSYRLGDYYFTTNAIDNNTGSAEDYRDGKFIVGTTEYKELEALLKLFVDKKDEIVKAKLDTLNKDDIKLKFNVNRDKNEDKEFAASNIQVWINEDIKWVDLDAAHGRITTIINEGVVTVDVQAVQDKIDALPEAKDIVLADDENAVILARNAYTALTAGKSEVKTAKLVAAETEIAAQKDANAKVTAYEDAVKAVADAKKALADLDDTATADDKTAAQEAVTDAETAANTAKTEAQTAINLVKNTTVKNTLQGKFDVVK